MTGIPLPRIYFFSRGLSITLRGPSGKAYCFEQSTKRDYVDHPLDVTFFRNRDDVVEEGGQPRWETDNRGGAERVRPLSYHETGATRATVDPNLLKPPTQDEMEAATRRRRFLEAQQKAELEAQAAAATEAKGIGTPEAQAAREFSREVAAGKRRYGMPGTERKPMSRPVPPPVEVAPPPVQEEPEPVVEEPVQKRDGFACRYCGKEFKNERGLQTHEQRWCDKRE